MAYFGTVRLHAYACKCDSSVSPETNTATYIKIDLHYYNMDLRKKIGG